MTEKFGKNKADKNKKEIQKSIQRELYSLKIQSPGIKLFILLDESTIRENNQIDGNDEQIMSEYIGYDENGKIYWEGNLLNGKAEGEWIAYFENGNISYKKYFKNGNREGRWINYREDGLLQSESSYKDGDYIEDSYINH